MQTIELNKVKDIEARIGVILRQYTNYKGHLGNFIQQFHAYDLLLIGKKIHFLWQELRGDKIDFALVKTYIAKHTKSKSYRKQQIQEQGKMPESYDDYIDVIATYEDVWPIISKPFVLQKTKQELFSEYLLLSREHNLNDKDKQDAVDLAQEIYSKCKDKFVIKFDCNTCRPVILIY